MIRWVRQKQLELLVRYLTPGVLIIFAVATAGCIPLPQTLYSEGPGNSDIKIERDKGEILEDFGSPLEYTIDGRYFLYRYKHGTDWAVGDVITPVVGAFLLGVRVEKAEDLLFIYDLPDSHNRGFALIEFDRNDIVKQLKLHGCAQGTVDKICGETVTDVLWPTIIAMNGEAQTKQYRIALESIEQKTRPLLQAINIGNLEEVARLISKGADVSAVVDGRTALHLAAISGNFDIVELLINRKAPVEAIDLDGRTPLHVVAKSGQVEIAELLAKQGVNVNARDSRGSSPLFGAVENQQISMAKWLIDRGAKVNWQNQWKETALHAAVRNNDEAMVKLLLEKGARADQSTIEKAIEVAKTKNAVAQKQNQLINTTGTYISIYTGEYLKKSPDFRYESPLVRLVQVGEEITGTFGSQGMVWGDIVGGETIRFEIYATGGFSRRGIWKIDSVNNKLEGKMISDEAEGWHLTKIE